MLVAGVPNVIVIIKNKLKHGYTLRDGWVCSHKIENKIGQRTKKYCIYYLLDEMEKMRYRILYGWKTCVVRVTDHG